MLARWSADLAGGIGFDCRRPVVRLLRVYRVVPVFGWPRFTTLHDVLDLDLTNGLVLDQRLGHCMQLVDVLFKQVLRTLVV